MFGLALVAAAAVSVLPCEYEVDYGAVPVPSEYTLTIDLIARDGKRETVPIEWAANTTTRDNMLTTAGFLRTLGWDAFAGPGTSLVVRGRKDGKPIHRVMVHSTAPGAGATVRWVPLPPAQKK